MKNGQKRTITLAAILALACVSGMAQQGNGNLVPANPVTAASSKPGDAASGAGFQNRYPRYKLASGDIFDLSFELSPEFNQQTISVQPDGFVTLRGIGEVHVAGQTVPELTATLRTAYSKILNDPLISVTLKDFEKPYFIADGQVGRPGKYELRGDTTLTEAIAMAGGFQDSARHSQVLLFRRVSDDWVSAKIINVKKMHASGNLQEDPLLHSGDMLFVPKNTFSKIRPFIPTPSLGTFMTP
ncbi:MAG: polysaccharide biosynthesis/export family protein [Terriglobales bacterium]